MIENIRRNRMGTVSFVDGYFALVLDGNGNLFAKVYTLGNARIVAQIYAAAYADAAAAADARAKAKERQVDIIRMVLE